jgi:hypothetical protein
MTDYLHIPPAPSRAAGVISAFGLMAAFHVYSLVPLLPSSALWRIGLFFIVNGIYTVAEAAVWGRRKHCAKRWMAIAFQLAMTSWTVKACHIPLGLGQLDWRKICDTPQWAEGVT